jgi:subtilase family protein
LREEYGYEGSVDLVKRRLRALRPPAVRATQRTGYRPGQVLQLDWAEMPTRPTLAGRERRVYALVASLPYSGAQTAFFSFEMTLEAFLEGHDTGVRWTHEALKSKYRGWNGVAADHNYNWHDAIHNPDPTNVCGASSPTPCDDDTLLGGGHGTHTVGTMVGSGPPRATQKNEIGMAPDAKWMACRNMSHGLGAVPTYLECMQWFLAPTKVDGTGADSSKAPDVVNNSWGCVEGCPPPALQDTLRASRGGGDLLRRLGRERRR